MKRLIYFTEAFEIFTGKKWSWHNPDGTYNYPHHSQDKEVRAFHQGFVLGRQTGRLIKDKIRDVEHLEDEVKQLRKELLAILNGEDKTK